MFRSRLVLVLLLLVNLTYLVSSQPTAAEVNSVSWILDQYGVSGIPRDATMCNYVGITCSLSGVNKIELDIETYVSGSPLAPGTIFSFPALQTLVINRTSISIQVTDQSQNILDKLQNLPNLSNIKIYNDPTISSIQDTLSTGLPSLAYLDLRGSANLVSISSGFFNHTKLISFLVLGSPIQDFSINSTIVNLPALTSFKLSFRSNTPKLLDFQSTSFPKLATFELNNNVDSPSIAVNLNCSASAITFLGNNFQISLNNASKLAILRVEGKDSTIWPSLDQYPQLQFVEINNSTLTSYPFTQFPPQIVSLSFPGGEFTSVPNIPLPSQVKTLNLNDNQLAGGINFVNVFQNTVEVRLNVSNNPGLIGTIPLSFCANYLHANNTGLESIPDCFWCYQGDSSLVTISPLQPPTNFVCNVEFYNTPNQVIATQLGIATLLGKNLGYGHYDQIAGYKVQTVIPNSNMHLEFTPLKQVGPPRNVSIRLHPYIGNAFNFTVVEAGITLFGHTISQQPNNTRVSIYTTFYNYMIDHSLTLTSIETGEQTNCVTISQLNTIYNCQTPSVLPFGNYSITFTNGYYNASISKTEFLQFYPLTSTVTPLDMISTIGSRFNFTGFFSSTSKPSVVFNTINGNSSCTVSSFTSGTISCTLDDNIKGPTPNVYVFIDSYHFVTSNLEVNTPYSVCMNETSNCNSHGECSSDGFCVCNPLTYYNNCSILYPTLSSSNYNVNNSSQLTFYGDFGPYNQTGAFVSINNTIGCVIEYLSQDMINCTLLNEPSAGLSSVSIKVDNLTVSAKDAILFPVPSSKSSSSDNNGESPLEKCRRITSDCYGHGYCNDDGICVCDTDYNSNDNCRTQFANSSNTANTTAPTVSFDIDGMKFNFEIYSIQEILDSSFLPSPSASNVQKELLISNYKWNFNISYSDALNTTTTGNYHLNITSNNDTTSQFYNLNVTSTISFSKQPRDIPFGSQSIHINPNSIKLAVSITGWQYESNLATLKVLFKTTLANNQTFVYDCDQQQLDSFTYDDLSSTIQYLRVAKDNVQFNGRFIDYVLSDGRPTYSKTELVSLTPIEGSDEENKESVAIIGINFPQCRECMLDPDFTPLLIEKGNTECDEKSNAWRIIVGCVVGGVGAIAIATATTILIKKKMLFSKQQRAMEHKLNSIGK